MATDPATGNAFDSLLLLTALNPGGTYVLILSQNDNFANGPTYGDGFGRSGQGNFTAGAFGCGGNRSVLRRLVRRSGTATGRWTSWRAELPATSPTPASGVPEPGTTLLLVTGLSSLVAAGTPPKNRS